MGSRITGVGAHLPPQVLTNSQLSSRLGVSQGWIERRCGIVQRRIASTDEETSDLALGAAREALLDSGCSPRDIDLLIVATATPDKRIPSTACILQRKLGAGKAVCFDLNAACTGLLYALQVAHSMICSGACSKALIVGVEKTSEILDFGDRDTCVLFGDGAGAFVLEKTKAGDNHILGLYLGSDGQYEHLLYTPQFDSTTCSRTPPLRMEGKELFRLSIRSMVSASKRVLDEVGLCVSEVDWFVPHQANSRVLDAVTARLGISRDKTLVNIEMFGNTSAASIAIGLKEVHAARGLLAGDIILMSAFGAGATWGAALIRW